MPVTPSHSELAEIVRINPCSYALINTVAVMQPRNRLLELGYAHDLLLTSGHDFTRAEIEDAFNQMASRGLGIAQTTPASDLVFAWATSPLVLQEALRLGCLPGELLSVPEGMDVNQVHDMARELADAGVPIIAVLSTGRAIRLEVPRILTAAELDQITAILTSLRGPFDPDAEWPFPTRSKPKEARIDDDFPFVDELDDPEDIEDLDDTDNEDLDDDRKGA